MANELGINLIPQYTDFNIKFQNITLNSNTFLMQNVGKWIFAMGTAPGAASLVKNSSNNAADFIVATGDADRYVQVAVRASEISNGNGTYYVGLFSEVSGSITGHLSKYISIDRNIKPSGV